MQSLYLLFTFIVIIKTQMLTTDPTEEGGRNQASTYIYIHLDTKKNFEFYSLRLRYKELLLVIICRKNYLLNVS